MSDEARAGSTAASAGGLALAVLCAQQFNMSYDTVGMNVALSTIIEDLDTTLTGMQAAIAMYAVVMAAFMITGAKLADRWGRRRTFMIGTLVYGIGSGITALSPSLAVLIGVLIAVGATQLQQSPELSNAQKDRFGTALASSTQTMSNTQVEDALQGESPRVVQEVVDIYAEARNIGMQAA